MRTPTRKGRQLVAIRLTDIDITVRRRYGRLLLEHAAQDGNLTHAVDLRRAIETPSDRIYWLPLDCVHNHV